MNRIAALTGILVLGICSGCGDNAALPKDGGTIDQFAVSDTTHGSCATAQLGSGCPVDDVVCGTCPDPCQFCNLTRCTSGTWERVEVPPLPCFDAGASDSALPDAAVDAPGDGPQDATVDGPQPCGPNACNDGEYCLQTIPGPCGGTPKTDAGVCPQFCSACGPAPSDQCACPTFSCETTACTTCQCLNAQNVCGGSAGQCTETPWGLEVSCALP